ncbi:hypothetical protein BDV25DRAFT_33776 [Aspergillus avenaceus]|uniref:Secreted protein n=1 Tax=Aspergillus avenaceus TaxID=36643 RepID=A0A5N6TM32_ASPAV|nr:hypothetical protein BDV25DRAFT_33776 [Aspergillus avenaceus]
MQGQTGLLIAITCICHSIQAVTQHTPYHCSRSHDNIGHGLSVDVTVDFQNKSPFMMIMRFKKFGTWVQCGYWYR